MTERLPTRSHRLQSGLPAASSTPKTAEADPVGDGLTDGAGTADRGEGSAVTDGWPSSKDRMRPASVTPAADALAVHRSISSWVARRLYRRFLAMPRIV
jgi:hypothetical protein